MGQPLIGTRSTALDYPAGSSPWSGGPTKIAPSASYFTPGTGAAAPALNFELNLAFSNVAAVQIAGGDSTIAQNWQPQFVAESGAYTLNAMAWNATLNLWVCANTYNSSAFNFFSTLTGTDSTTTVNFGTGFTPTGTVAGIACDNSGCSYMTRISGGLGYVETITPAAVQTGMGAFNAATSFPVACPSGQSFAMAVLVSGSAAGSEIFYLTNSSHTAEVTGLSLTNAVVAANATTCAAVYIGASGVCSVTMATGGTTTTLSISSQSPDFVTASQSTRISHQEPQADFKRFPAARLRRLIVLMGVILCSTFVELYPASLSLSLVVFSYDCPRFNTAFGIVMIGTFILSSLDSGRALEGDERRHVHPLRNDRDRGLRCGRHAHLVRDSHASSGKCAVGQLLHRVDLLNADHAHVLVVARASQSGSACQRSIRR